MTYIKNEREYYYPPNNYQQVVHDFLQTKEFEKIVRKKIGFWNSRKYSKEIIAIAREYEGIARALLEFLKHSVRQEAFPMQVSENRFIFVSTAQYFEGEVAKGYYWWTDDMRFFSGNYGERISLMWENKKPPVLRRSDLYEKKDLQQLSKKELSIINDLFSSKNADVHFNRVTSSVSPMFLRDIMRINDIASAVRSAVGRDSLFQRFRGDGIDA